jgi:3,4-dihydroxy-2-butanone 4-phosphate synthase
MMVPERNNACPRGTAFGISFEARAGVTTGISAFDRAHSIRTAIADSAEPETSRYPGTYFRCELDLAAFSRDAGTPRAQWTWHAWPVAVPVR